MCGLLDPVGPGITPGSGPPISPFSVMTRKEQHRPRNPGRAGIDYPMTEKDLLIRVNFATVDRDGLVTDRRAGRIDNDTNRRVCRKLQEGIRLQSNVPFFFEPVKEHRALLVLRMNISGMTLKRRIPRNGEAAAPAAGNDGRGERYRSGPHGTGEGGGRVLADEEKANMILLRGYANTANSRASRNDSN